MAYIFDPDELHQITRRHLDGTREQAFDGITAELAERYPGHIDAGPRKWIFNNAGGAMGQIALLHGSLTEYVLLFGTPIGTEGHSGRYATEVYDFMIDGEMWCYLEGETDRVVYEPGSMAVLGKSAAKGYRVPDRAWMLEYARGPIPSMLPFGLADSMLSTLDVRAFARTVGVYAKQVVGSLTRGKI